MASVDDDDLYADLYGADEGDDSRGAASGKEDEPSAPQQKDDSADLPGLNGSAAAPAPAPAAVSAPAPAPAPAPQHAAAPASVAPPPAPRYEQDAKPIMTYSSETEPPKQSRFSGPQASYSEGGDNQYPPYNSTFNDDPNRRDARGYHSVRPSEMPDEGKMFVGGLNWDTTDETLRGYFTQFGEVDACTIMRDAGGRSRGFAFLTFKDPAAVNAVMVREHYLDGKIIDPKRAIPRLEHQRTQKLFVGGLAPSVTSDSMKDFFLQFGRVIDATVMVDRDSSRSKGFGFVTFEDGQGVEKLVGQGILSIDGKGIEVKLAQPRGALRREEFGHGDHGYDNRGGGGGGGYGRGGNRFDGPRGGAPNAMSGGSTGSSGVPFDPQAMAALYQRMQWQMSQGGMNMGMMNPMGGMNGMGNMGNMGMMNGMGNMGMMNGMGNMGMMGNPMGRGMGMANGMGGGMGMANGMGGMNGMAGGRGAGMMNNAGGVPNGSPTGSIPSAISPVQGNSQTSTPSMGTDPRKPPAAAAGIAANPNIPRGPAAMRVGAGPVPNPQQGAGPMRTGGRGSHNYHPYGRG